LGAKGKREGVSEMEKENVIVQISPSNSSACEERKPT
jgi:hypothetical protein